MSQLKPGRSALRAWEPAGMNTRHPPSARTPDPIWGAWTLSRCNPARNAAPSNPDFVRTPRQAQNVRMSSLGTGARARFADQSTAEHSDAPRRDTSLVEDSVEAFVVGAAEPTGGSRCHDRTG